eukprot:857896-Rhodomonas_salina.1
MAVRNEAAGPRCREVQEPRLLCRRVTSSHIQEPCLLSPRVTRSYLREASELGAGAALPAARELRKAQKPCLLCRRVVFSPKSHLQESHAAISKRHLGACAALPAAARELGEADEGLDAGVAGCDAAAAHEARALDLMREEQHARCVRAGRVKRDDV